MICNILNRPPDSLDKKSSIVDEFRNKNDTTIGKDEKKKQVMHKKQFFPLHWCRLPFWENHVELRIASLYQDKK